MIPLRYHVRSLLERRAMAGAAALGVALSVLVLGMVVALRTGLGAALDRSGADDVAMVLRAGSEAELTSQFPAADAARVVVAPAIQAGPDGQPLAEAEVGGTMSFDRAGGDGISSLVLRGIGPRSLALRSGVRIAEGRAPAAGADEAMIGAALVGRFEGLRKGGQLPLGLRPLTVVGVLDARGGVVDSEIWAERDAVQRATGREALISSVRARLRAPSELEALRSRVEEDRSLELRVEGEPAYFERQRDRSTAFVLGIGTLVCAGFALAALLGAAVTLHALVAGRKAEIGVLRALGFSARQVLASFLLESVMVTLFGGALGIAGALALSGVELSLVNPANFSEVVFSLEPSAGMLGASGAMALAMGLCGGFLPALRAARTRPAEAVRDRD